MSMTPDQRIARLEYVVREQMAEISRQRDEIDRLLGWINGDTDALTTLQGVYLDPEESAGNKIKAAAAAIGYERPKMATTASRSWSTSESVSARRGSRLRWSSRR